MHVHAARFLRFFPVKGRFFRRHRHAFGVQSHAFCGAKACFLTASLNALAQAVPFPFAAEGAIRPVWRFTFPDSLFLKWLFIVIYPDKQFEGDSRPERWAAGARIPPSFSRGHIQTGDGMVVKKHRRHR